MDRIFSLMVAKTNLDSRLILRFGDYADIGIVTKFIDEHWKPGHILTRDRELFEYLYLEKNGRLNFVIAIDEHSGEMVAMLGYIPTDKSHSRIGLSMWMSRPDATIRQRKVGLSVLRFLINEVKPKRIFSSGIGPDTKIVYEFLGYFCDRMDHFVLVNNQIDEFRIIKNPPRSIFDQLISDSSFGSLSVVSTEKDLRHALSDFEFDLNPKDADYFCHRYLSHPRFKYEIRKVLVDGVVTGVIVFRRSFALNRSCIRIIDVIGGEESLRLATKSLTCEMITNGDEYIDLLCWGLNSDHVQETGFFDRREFVDCIVPDYFSPFLQSNSDCWLFTNSPSSEKIFKGDGDQDRPN